MFLAAFWQKHENINVHSGMTYNEEKNSKLHVECFMDHWWAGDKLIKLNKCKRYPHWNTHCAGKTTNVKLTLIDSVNKDLNIKFINVKVVESIFLPVW